MLLAELPLEALTTHEFPFEQAPRALQPSVRHRVLAAKRPAVPGQPDGHAGGIAVSPAIEIQPVRALACVEHDICEIEPPGC